VQIFRNRVCISLQDLASGRVVDWSKVPVLIGDGESKTKYIFNRRETISFGINRAVKHYPADMMVCSRGHFETLDTMIDRFIPFVIIEVADGKIFPLINGANAVVFLSFIISQTMAKVIYIQGFDFTRSDQPGYNWKHQATGFLKCQKAAEKKGIKIITTKKNHYLFFVPEEKPPSTLLLKG
jgi:hypothetical protein